MTPGLFWRDDSPEELDPYTYRYTPRMTPGPTFTFLANTEPFFKSLSKSFQKLKFVSLDAVGLPFPDPGTWGPGTLTEWQDDADSGQDDAPRLPVCPAHGTLPRSGLCRKCVRGR